MEAKEKAREQAPSESNRSHALTPFLKSHEGCKEQGGKDHAIGGDDQGRRITELDEDGSCGHCADSDEKQKKKATHRLKVSQLDLPFK
jgi:hypothetical protein